jgi:hypothetical protein
MPYGSNEHLITGFLNNLNYDHWYDVDHNFGRLAHEFFVDRGTVYTRPAIIFRGREAIREFYRRGAWLDRDGSAPGKLV